METAYIIRNGIVIGSGSSSSVDSGSSNTYIINCTIVSETGLEIEVHNYDGDFAKIKQTIADGEKVELRTNFNSSNYILEPSRIEEDYVTFNAIDKNANITIKVTEYGINDVSYIDLNSNGEATIDDAVTSTETTWSSEKIVEKTPQIFKIYTITTTKYIEIIPNNSRHHISIISQNGDCVEIYGSVDDTNNTTAERPKAVRISYGDKYSNDASEKSIDVNQVFYYYAGKRFYLKCKALYEFSIEGAKSCKLLNSNDPMASMPDEGLLEEIPIIPLIPKKDFYRVVAQDKAGYFKFKPSSDGGNEQPLRATATDNYGGMIEISGNAPSQDQYKPFKCVRLSNGTYASYDATNTTNNKMKKLYLYDGYMYLQVETYTTVTFTGLIEEPTFVETLADTSTEIPIVSLVNPSIKAAAGSNINSVGTPSVTASESNGTTTFTFNNLKGATGGKGDTGTRGSQWFRGTGITGTSTTATVFSGSGVLSALVNDMYLNTSTSYVYQCTVAGNASAAKWVYIGTLKGTTGTTPTIKAAAGSNINTVGTPSVTASTSGTTTTFTFNNLKGAAGTNGTTPTIKVANGSNINSVGTPSVSASTSGTTTTLTFDYLKGAKGAAGAAGKSPLTHIDGSGGGEKTIATLSPGEGVIIICNWSSGGTLHSEKTDGSIYFNGATMTGSKGISAGNYYTVTNSSLSTSSRIYIKGNGGARVTVIGDID